MLEIVNQRLKTDIISSEHLRVKRNKYALNMSVSRSNMWSITNSEEFLDQTTSKLEYRQYYDKKSITHSTNPNLKDFSIQSNEPDSYILPSAGYLKFSFQLTKTGTNSYLQ
jgi:hypothetical protein